MPGNSYFKPAEYIEHLGRNVGGAFSPQTAVFRPVEGTEPA
jgi:hypothetical protein